MPKDQTIRKVLVIGSGPIVIGQAAEFDYAGAQACRVLKQEGINVVLVNSNPATIMTDQHLADEIYLEPLNAATIRRVIEKERPDGLISGLGGQTGLTLAMQLSRDGTLDEFGVRLLGSPISAIEKAEDREKFRKTMLEIGQPCVPSEIAENLEDALKAATDIGYPVIVRPAYTLGGSGGGIASDEEEMRQIARAGLDASLSPRFWWKSALQDGRKSNSKPCATPRKCNRRMLHGKRGPGRHSHRRQRGCRTRPDTLGQGISDAPFRVAGYHQRHRHRGRLQLPVCPESGFF